jgi:hypothetical protein
MPAVTAEEKIIVLSNKFFPAQPEADLEDIDLIIYFPELGSESQITEINIIKILNKIKIWSAPDPDKFINKLFKIFRETLILF